MAIFAPPLRRSLQEFQAVETRVIGDGPRVRVSGTGIGLGVWQTWTPTYANLTVGNGTVVARYAQIGNAVTVRWRLALGSTSVIGTAPTVSLPVTASTSGISLDGPPGGWSDMKETGGSNFLGPAFVASSTTAGLFVHKVDGTHSTVANITVSVPFTWGDTDFLSFVMVYEAA